MPLAGVPKQRIRMIEIDTAHAGGVGADELGKLIHRLVESACSAPEYAGTALEIRDRFLPDADFPNDHESYYIGLCYPDAEARVGSIADGIIHKIKDACLRALRQRNIPNSVVLEVGQSEAGFERLLEQMWPDRLAGH